MMLPPPEAVALHGLLTELIFWTKLLTFIVGSAAGPAFFWSLSVSSKLGDILRHLEEASPLVEEGRHLHEINADLFKLLRDLRERVISLQRAHRSRRGEAS